MYIQQQHTPDYGLLLELHALTLATRSYALLPPHLQGVFLLITYFFVSCHTLTRKHKKYGINDEVEPLTIPGEPDYLGSLSTLASSRQQLIPEVCGLCVHVCSIKACF